MDGWMGELWVWGGQSRPSEWQRVDGPGEHTVGLVAAERARILGLRLEVPVSGTIESELP